jgi:uncharacterized membrane protein
MISPHLDAVPTLDDSGIPHGQEPVEDETGSEQVWTYRGYHLHASEFTTAMVHMFRAEVQRANVWRQRLDTTTNWAVVSTGAVISFAFTQIGSHHIAIPLTLILVTIFLVIEARRYRYYELWSYRIRLMETDFFAAMLVPPFHPAADWAETLAEHLLHPQFPISGWEAFGRRLRRNYLWIYIVIGLAWLTKLWVVPTPAAGWKEMFFRANLGSIPGQVILAIGLVFYLILFLISLLTFGLRHASGEVLPRYSGLMGSLSGFNEGMGSVSEDSANRRAWFRPSRRRQQFLTQIITQCDQKLANRILKEMRRGVTNMPCVGMYSGESRSILLVALTVTEIPQLRAIVSEEDPKAFVIITPAQEVFGTGFVPLQNKEQL